jgi:hypothetical protein
MGEYEADLPTLLRRAVGLAWNEKPATWRRRLWKR